MKPFSAIVPACIVSASLICPNPINSEEAEWGQVAIFANKAFSRGDLVSACRLAIHAAHMMNKVNPGSSYEVEYMRDYVAKYCGSV